MRPLLGDDARVGRSSSNDDVTQSMPPPMTYFIADEKTIESSSLPNPTLYTKHRNYIRKPNFGVEGYKTTTSSLIPDPNEPDGKQSNTKLVLKNLAEQFTSSHEDDQTGRVFQSSNPSPDFSRNPSPVRLPNSISRPFTPLSAQLPILVSSSNSSDSQVLSDVDSCADYIAGQDSVSNRGEKHTISFLGSGTTPQFVMPCIKMPSRRPFTEKGKNMGRMKILIAGDSGIGKTSLVKAIVQTCDDIVHVDPIRASSPNLCNEHPDCSRQTKPTMSDIESTSQITEIYASTRPYPAWWSELDENRPRKRRSSAESTVLERNLCFVDTPGYGDKTSPLECISSVFNYVESQFKKISISEGPNESEMINMLCGNGGSQVDLVLYLISCEVKAIDIEYMRRLSHLTNIIPLVAQSDKHSEQQILKAKNHIVSELSSAKIEPFFFRLNSDLTLQSNSPQFFAPYAISSRNSKDYETMDASLLMSPDYVQPLVESELKILISKMYERDSISWLRYSAAKKYILWRSLSDLNAVSKVLYQPLSTLPSSQFLTAPVCDTTSYDLARIIDHTQREMFIAQVRLVNWAADLSRSLQNDHSHFESIARGERAVWLTARLSECVQEGTSVSLPQNYKENNSISSEFSASTNPNSHSCNFKTDDVDTNDPLGLIFLSYHLRRKGQILLKVIGSLGIVSGFAYWATRVRHENCSIFELGFRDWFGLGVLKCLTSGIEV